MIGSFIIILREVLEAALIVGIIVTYLVRSGNRQYIRGVVASASSAIIVSIIGAVLFVSLAGGFTGRTEAVYEGIIMIIGAALVSTMVIWMISEQNHMEKLEAQVSASLSSGRIYTLYAIVFVSILREGIEVVLFMQSLWLRGESNLWIGSLMGFAVALGLSWLLFFGGKRLSLGSFFRITNVLLLLFAGGMLAYGIHELQEAGAFPIFIEHIWDINHALNEDSAIGGLLKGLFGYNGNPSLLEVVAYSAFVITLGGVWRKTTLKKVSV
ncbi:MAG: FTR1 family protein [Spirochaetales bacterium]|nr:FTR1 family protein [Spirochaetales bacterium]MCF7938255.1 FTR1 family protein [Spirochaetales bacterium]